MDEDEIKKQLAELQNQIEESRKQTTDQRIANLEKELNLMKDRYIQLLEHTLELKGSQQKEASGAVSTRRENVQLDRFQLLILLQQSKAMSPEFAVSATQLKQAYSLNKTTRTIRDKLTSLELMNLLTSYGQKPKLYYLTPRGLQMISQQQRGMLEVH